jgi:hypothetical protein
MRNVLSHLGLCVALGALPLFAADAPSDLPRVAATAPAHPTAEDGTTLPAQTPTSVQTRIAIPNGGVLLLDGRPATEQAAFLGVSVSSVSPELREQLKLGKGVGLVVNHVETGSPAEAAGVKRFDVLERLDEQILIEARQLSVLIRLHNAGDEVKLNVIREAKPQTLTAKLVDRDLPPLDQQNSNPFAAGAGGGGPFGIQWSDGELNIDLLQDHGRRIVARNKAGDIIFEGAIDTPEELQKIPQEVRAKAMKIIRGTSTQPASTTQPDMTPYRSTLKPFKFAPPPSAKKPAPPTPTSPPKSAPAQTLPREPAPSPAM